MRGLPGSMKTIQRPRGRVISGYVVLRKFRALLHYPSLSQPLPDLLSGADPELEWQHFPSLTPFPIEEGETCLGMRNS